MKYKKGDRLVLHSENGIDYDVEVVSANPYRPPGSEYAIDVYMDSKALQEDVYFVGEDFLDKCEPKGESDGEM